MTIHERGHEHGMNMNIKHGSGNIQGYHHCHGQRHGHGA
jgi:hypothetical protein